ncbi:hypothetical protein M413DRAFT_31963 [Hebeloma cylindrosporum]|uniref:Uncharacterized protein n=1 Tax=Hebeloma cylindrosporum TaxID=76867 RepID=A0A0C3BX62_HEBCY|nr:hypothetical protein M413DRAFT_31963 [Hebeloma cylindrosporum h7]
MSQQLSRASTPTPMTPNISLPTAQALVFRPAERPANLPSAILWLRDDCSKEDTARPSPQNPARPPMRQAIRKKDGTTISASHYSMIRNSGNRLVNLLLEHHSKSGSSEQPKMSCSKKLYYPEWRKAVLELEREHPVRTYCCNNWKAEQMLGNIIRSRKTSALKRKRGLSIPTEARRR